MSHLQINVDEEKKQFVITDQSHQIIGNYRAKSFFSDVLKADFFDGHKIIIPYSEEEAPEEKLNKIKTSLKKYSITEPEPSEEVKQIFDDYYTEQENFKEFSQKAKNIWNNQVDAAEFRSFKDFLEKNFQRKLYEKQLLAAFHLTFSQNACNFSVPGSGKTSMVYAAYSYLKGLPENDPKKVNKLLIIGPLSSFGPWEQEYHECFGLHVNSKRLSGGVSPEEREKHLLTIDPAKRTPELLLMSYQSIPNDLDLLLQFLKKKDHKVMAVLDEAHYIKNPKGVWADAVLQLSKYCKARVILTGTPVPNGYEDIYNLYQFIWPDKDIIDFRFYHLVDMSKNELDKRISKLINNISPFFIRIKKSDLGLPRVEDHEPIYVEMDEAQREIYDLIEGDYMSSFQETQGSDTFTSQLIKAKLIRLMQVATNPRLLEKPLDKFFLEEGLSNELYIDDRKVIDKITNYKKLSKTPRKFELLKDMILDLLDQKGKVIIWAIFIQNIKELQEYLKQFKIESRILIGEVPVETDDLSSEIETREKIIEEFHDIDSSFKVIIANPFAVAESISLHKACHTAIYLERNFNAARFLQSKDRIHRVGLDKNIITNYYYILSENSIDGTIHNRLLEKEKRMLQLIESKEIPLFTENFNNDVVLKDDLKRLIQDYVRRAS